MRKNLLSILLALLALPMFAQQVSVDDAMLSARKFLSATAQRDGKKLVNAKIDPQLAYTSKIDGKNTFYVFNNDAGKGFVIVGADQAAEEILGYSEGGTFDYDKIPANMKWWLSQYDSQISLGIKQGVNARKAPRKASAVKEDVEEIVKVKWNQGYPYNSQIPDIFINSGGTDPKDGYNRCATGCVATAMAQAMSVYKYPTQSQGGEKTLARIVNGVRFTTVFGNEPYDWANMKKTYTGNEDLTDPSVKAIGKLLYDCGMSVDMNYGTLYNGGSSASLANAAGAFVNNFGYDKSIQYLTRNDFNDEQWENMLYTEIAAGRPVPYGGQSTGGGHAFVLHGYKKANDTYAINWGWGGYCDGYFKVTGTPSLNPDGDGIGGAGAGSQYTGGQEMIIGMQPNKGGDYAWSMAFIDYSVARGFVEQQASLGGKMTLRGTFKNTSAAPITAQVGVLFTDNNGNEAVSPISYKAKDLGTNYYTTTDNWDVYVPGSLPAGDYKVSLVFKTEKGEWQEMRNGPSYQWPTITLVDDLDFRLDRMPVFGTDNVINTNIKDCKLYLRVKNNTNSDMQKKFDCYIYPGAGGFSLASLTAGTVTIPANKGKSVLLTVPSYSSYSDLVDGGDYFAVLMIDGQQYGPRLYPTVDGSATVGVTLMPADEQQPSDGIYTITGSRLDRITAPGIYIKNGKKVIVK